MGRSGREALGELRYWGHDPQLNPLDALMWRTERPPANSCTVLDRVPDERRAMSIGLFALPLLVGETGVDKHGGPGDVTARVGYQVQDRIRDVFGFDQSILDRKRILQV